MEKEYNRIGNDKELRDFVNNEILFASEVADLLNVTKPHVNNLVCKGKLVPVKRSRVGNLFLKQDILEYNKKTSNAYDVGIKETLKKYILHRIKLDKGDDFIVNGLIEIFDVEEEKAKNMLFSIREKTK